MALLREGNNQPTERETDMNELKVRITFTEPVLGTRPADPEIHARFVASKAPDAKTMEQELAEHEVTVEDLEERQKTIFPKMEDGTPYLYTYMLKGYFKDTAKALKKVSGTESSKRKAFLKLIDNNIFVRGHVKGKPRVMPLFMPVDLDLTATDNQRPLRASTPQGERVALAHSEEAPAGSYFECSIYCDNEPDLKWVREMLDRGEWKGMGQWRNADYGLFQWEEIG